MKPRRGRPPLDPTGRSVSVHVRMTTGQYDALCKRAQLSRRSVSSLVRCVMDATEPKDSVTTK